MFSNTSRVFGKVKVKLVVASILLVVLIRASTGFWKCREEQNCLTEKDSSKTHYILTLVLLGVFVTVSRSWLKLCGNLTGFSPTTMVCRYCPTIMVVCTGGFWALRRLPKDGKYDHQADLLVRTVYGSALLGLLTLLASPLRLYVLPDKSGVEEDESRMVAYVFNRIKGLLGGYRGGEDESSVPVVYGLATVYSSAFFVLAMFLCLLLALLVGDVAAASLVILTISAGFVLVVTSIARYEKVTNTGKSFEKRPHRNN